jgi:hypothetical protein
LKTALEDGVERKLESLRVVAYDLPEGCVAGYYSACKPPLPFWHNEEKSKVPEAESIAVLVQRPIAGCA